MIVPSQSPAPSLKSATLDQSSTIPEEEERPSTDSSFEELASWARGLGKKKSRPRLSKRYLTLRASDGRVSSMTRDSMSSMHGAGFGESISNITAAQEVSQRLDSLRSPTLNDFPSEDSSFDIFKRAANRSTSWSPDVAPKLRSRRGFSASSSSSPRATNFNHDEPSSSFASRAQKNPAPSSPPQATTSNSDRPSLSFPSRVLASVPRSPDGDGRRYDRAVSDPIYSHSRPGNIARDTRPTENESVDLNTEQYFAPLSERKLEELSEEEQLNIAIIESLKVSEQESMYRYR